MMTAEDIEEVVMAEEMAEDVMAVKVKYLQGSCWMVLVRYI